MKVINKGNMAKSESQSLTDFEEEVIDHVKYLKQLGDPDSSFEKIQNSINLTEQFRKSYVLKLFLKAANAMHTKWVKPSISNVKKRLRIEEYRVAAEKWVTYRDIKRILVTVLEGVDNDALEIAKIITPKLYRMKYRNDHIVPSDPKLFAMMAIIISEIGVEKYCSEV